MTLPYMVESCHGAFEIRRETFQDALDTARNIQQCKPWWQPRIFNTEDMDKDFDGLTDWEREEVSLWLN